MKQPAFLLSILWLATTPAFAAVSYVTSGSAYTQNFTSLSTATDAAQTWTNNSTITGWHARSSGAGDFTSYTPAWQSGISAGVLYHNRNTDEAAPKKSFLGGRTTSGLGNVTVGLALENSTGGTLTTFDLSFLASQFFKTGVAQQMQVAFSTDATSLTTGTWTTISSLTYTAPYTTGNASVTAAEEVASRQTKLITGQSVTWENGEDLWIRWTSFRDISGTYTAGAAVLSITDVSFSAIPEPTSAASLLGGLGMLLMLRRRR